MASVWDEIESVPARRGPVTRSVWDDVEGGVRPPKASSRNALEFANDTVVTGVNSALGIGKAVSDFISVDNPVSRGLQYLIDEGEKTYSDQTRASREALNQAIDAGGWDAAKGVGEFLITSPVQAAAMAAGNFGPFGAAIKGARGLAAAGGLGAKGVRRTGMGAASALGGAAAGGDAAGDAYAQVMRSENIDPAIREELARQAAREASAVPAIIGAATPFLPGSAESQLAKGLGITRASIPRAVASEFGQEFVEEGATKLSANLAAQQYDPSIDASRGVFGSALLGGALGAGTGLGVTYLNNRAVEADLLRRDEAIAAQQRERQEQLAPILGMIRPDSGLGTQAVIDQQLGISPALAAKELEKQRKAREADILAAFNEPTKVRVAGEDGQERELTAIEASLLRQGLPTAPIAETPAPAAPTAPSVFKPEEQDLISKGVDPTPARVALWTQAKSSGLTENELDVVANELSKGYGEGKKAFQAILVARNKPASAAPPATPAPTAAPAPSGGLRVVKGTPPTPEVSTNVQAPQAVQAEAKREETLAAPAAQGTAPAAEPVVQRKRRVVNPAALQQSQAFVAPEVTEGQTPTEDSTPPASLSTEDQLAAAQATGNASELEALAEEDAGLRQDKPTLSSDEDERSAAVSEILGVRFADSKDPKRDAEIARAYWTALRDAPQGSKLKVQEAVGEQFGIKPVAVRKIGNTTEMVKAGASLGYSQEQVLELLGGLNDNAKANNAKAPAVESDETADMAGALQRAGVETVEGEEAGFGLDDDRSWTGAAFDSRGRPIYGDTENAGLEAQHNELVATIERIKKLKATIESLRAQGQADIADRVEAQRAALEAALAKHMEKAGQKKPAKTTAPAAAPATLSDEAKAAAAKFKAAGTNLDAMDDAELPALREAAARFKNTELMAKIDRRMGVEPGPDTVAAPAPAPKKPKKAQAEQAETADEDRLVLDREKAAEAWDRAANRSEGAIPSFEELTDEQQATFIGFGKNNWKLADINAFAEKEGLISEVQANDDRSDDLKFGKAGAVKNGYTAAELIAEIKAFIRADVLGRKLVVVDTVGDLLNSKLPMQRAIGAQIALEGAYGVAADGTAYLIADRIKKGSGRAKFMHEVGGHIGLEGLLPQAVYDRLVDQIEQWAKQDRKTQESELAKKALKRVEDAGTKPEDRRSELLAYFLEEAVESGVDPTADVMRGSSPLLQWFRTLWAAFKTAVRRLGMKPETLSAQDIVNLAFGAARLEIAGTWHGTAAEVETLDKRKLPFRRFDNRKIGSGEGAQAYGWGSYLAQRFGVGKAYFEADVDRKTTTEDVNVTYNGKPAWHMQGAMQEALSLIRSAAENLPKTVSTKDALQAAIDEQVENVQLAEKLLEGSLAWETTLGVAVAEANRSMLKHARELLDALAGMDHSKLEIVRQEANTPEGSVMRVDVAVKPEELMTWEKPIDQQPRKVREVLSRVAKATPYVDRKESIGHLYKRMAEMFTVNDLVENQSGGLEWVRRKDPDTYVLADTSLMLDGEQFDYIGNPKAASEWLDSMGVKGVTHTDAPSRDNQKVYQNYKKQRDLKAAFNSIPTDVKTNFNMRSTLDLAQDVEDAVRGGKDVEHIVRSLGLTGADADAAYEYADWLQDRTGNVIVFNDKNIFRVGARVAADKQRMRFGKDLREKLPAELQKPVGTITNVLNDTKNAALNTLTFTEDVINRAVSLGVKSAGRLRTIYQERTALTGKLEREVERVADLYNSVPEAERGTGDKSVNKFLYDATREGKWGFKPSWRKGTSANVKVDPDMKQRFDALSKESKALVEAVFKHGDEVLSLKKQTVITAADSEYDALIAEANKKNDAKKAASLAADKAAQLKRFNSLFELQEFKPYAPLKRFGPYVVIARSQKYLDADEKTQAKLENSDDDYHVSFAESAFAAREMVEQLQKQGAFAQVTFREREDVDPAMAGGALSAFNKLRATLDSELADAEPNEKAAIRAARKVIGELYLSTLAETSARKSEMRRRGVAGEIDMLRSFTTQGRADAQFIAGAKYNKQTLDAFNAMRKEVREPGEGEAENTKSRVVNELLKRHAQSMDYDPSPVTDKLARLTSVWFLATSPAYYLQNLTQPFMMSMPLMAGRHNYLKVGNALLKAYSDLAPMFRKVKLGEQFDYASAPADVRAAISTLVDRQRIDIGLDTDLGTFRIEGEGRFKDGWNKVDRGIRNVSQKMEAVNRLATAIAAYRVEIARTGDAKGALEYADSIIAQTHGDYTRNNAPRVFNTAPGKIALQFRKFQLIQLTLLAKLIKNSFTGKEQAAARKALSFTLAHTAVMAGAIGLPGFAAISWALGAMLGGGDDEPFNTEQALREWIGNDQLATLITRGAPASLGVDLSQKLGMGNVLSLLPFNDLDLSSRSGVESAAFSLIGGPAGGLTLRAIDGMNLIRDGLYHRGLEQLMPTGVTNSMKAYRIADEGVTRRNGDVLMSPDEISGMESFWQAIGFQPADQSLRQFRDKVKRDTDQKFQSRAEKIRNAYLRAKDDPEARAEAREQWIELQEAREEAGYRRQPLSALMRADQSQRERERNTMGGIQFNRDTRRFVEDLTQEQ